MDRREDRDAATQNYATDGTSSEWHSGSRRFDPISPNSRIFDPKTAAERPPFLFVGVVIRSGSAV
jgi:hypothetical protein